MPLAAYCQAYSAWRTAVEALQEMGRRDPATRGLIVKAASGGAVQNPVWLAAKQAANAMVRTAEQFGLSPAARARIAAGVYHDPAIGKFDGLLA